MVCASRSSVRGAFLLEEYRRLGKEGMDEGGEMFLIAVVQR